MNWLLVIVLLILLFSTYRGYRKGFIKKVLFLISIVVSLMLVSVLTPYISDFMMNKTPLYEKTTEQCIAVLKNDDYDADEKSGQEAIIETSALPDNIKALLLENNNSEFSQLLDATGFYQYAGAYLAKTIINAAAYFIAFVLLISGMNLLMKGAGFISRLPVIHGINKILGAITGFVQGLVFVWIGFLIVTIFCNGSVGQELFELISKSQILMFLYNTNIFFKLITKL